ncbi:MAG: acyltransferase family protein [Janthinobacterium lividum]
MRSRIGFGGLSILLVLAFFMPFDPGGWVREVIVITLYFPLLVMLGASATVSAKVAKICRFSGELSYPLYMTHYTIVRVWGAFVDQHALVSWGLGLSIGVGVFTTLLFSWLVSKLYDQPVRAYLRNALALAAC